MRIIMFLIMFFSIQTFAQNEDRNVLFKSIETESASLDIGFYSSKYSKTSMYGGFFNINLMFNSHFSFGLNFNLSETNSITFPMLTQVVKPRFDYYGVLISAEYLFFPNKMINFSFPIKTGLGYATYRDFAFVQYTNYNLPATFYKKIADDFFYVIEPGANIYLNLFKRLKIYGGVTYRIATGLNLLGTNQDFTKPTIQTGLRIIIDENQ